MGAAGNTFLSEEQDAESTDLPPSYLEATASHGPRPTIRCGIDLDTGNTHAVEQQHRSSMYSRDSSQMSADVSQSPHTQVSIETTHAASFEISYSDGQPVQALAPSYSDQATSSVPHSPGPFKLVAVPQIAKGLGMPFVRAYSPALQNFGISMAEFVGFIDTLNVASTASPPLQMLNVAGDVVGMVPHHIPQLVGNALSLSAKVGSAAVSKGRTAALLDAANRDLFAPRGLKVQLATSKALKASAGLNAGADLVSTIDDCASLDVQSRRMRALEGYVSPLTFDVPPPADQTNTLERMSAAQVARHVKKSEAKALEDREKALEKAGPSNVSTKDQEKFEKELRKIEQDRQKVEKEYDKEMVKITKERSKSDSSSKQLTKSGKEMDKAERKRQQELQKLEDEVKKAQRKFDKADSGDRETVSSKDKKDKEAEVAEKLLWILVERLV